MSGITGFCDFINDMTVRKDENIHILTAMRERLFKRGGAGHGEWLAARCGLAATWRQGIPTIDRLPSMPYEREVPGTTCVVVFDGEIYNRNKLWLDLQDEPRLNPLSRHTGEPDDAALIAAGFARYGTDFVRYLNGAFAFALWHNEALYLFRDHAGIKPLFYTHTGSRFLFASEMKALFSHPGVEVKIDRDGLTRLLALGPAREEHDGIFTGINAVPPGCFLRVSTANQSGSAFSARVFRYWDLTLRPHTDTDEETVATVRDRVTDAITRQTNTGGDVCAFLSGGVDSSVVTAVAAELLRREGKTLNTFSFDFKDSRSHFTANAYQPDLDRPWVDAMTAFSQTHHQYIECGPEELSALLGDAVTARDLPGMADIDASLLYFCSCLPKGVVALTGECADEIFGGYPWFHRADLIQADGFPWSHDIETRKTLFSQEILQTLDFDSAADHLYRCALSQAKKAVENGIGNPEETRLQMVSYLTIKWFMTTLTDRMDRMGAYAGIGARVPFADIHLMEYVWNVPWPLKRKEGTVKYLLREAMRGVVPDEVLFRKKSPFPKTYDPIYTGQVAARVTEDILNNPQAPVRDLLDIDKVRAFIDAPANISRPWFGQLMAGPQRLAWLWQVDYWLRQYKVQVVL